MSIRIEEELLKKLGYVAVHEGLFVNSHVLVLIRESVRVFEEAHGKIEDDISADVNVKPAKRD